MILQLITLESQSQLCPYPPEASFLQGTSNVTVREILDACIGPADWACINLYVANYMLIASVYAILMPELGGEFPRVKRYRVVTQSDQLTYQLVPMIVTVTEEFLLFIAFLVVILPSVSNQALATSYSMHTYV